MNKNLPRIVTIAVIVFAVITVGLWYFAKEPKENITQNTEITKSNQVTNQESVSCLDEPITLENGREQYPIDPKYSNVKFLGQLFTAYNCEPNRVDELVGVDNGEYTLGSYIWLNNKPGQELINVLKNIGYNCATDDTDAKCTEWALLDDTVSVDELMKLKQFYKDFKQDDCRYCG